MKIQAVNQLCIVLEDEEIKVFVNLIDKLSKTSPSIGFGKSRSVNKKELELINHIKETLCIDKSK